MVQPYEVYFAEEYARIENLAGDETPDLPTFYFPRFAGDVFSRTVAVARYSAAEGIMSVIAFLRPG